MPLPHPPTYNAAPSDVDNYLRMRGWFISSGNLWMKNSDYEISSEEFQWPEALAYEIFQNFVMLKTSGE